jgi:hypothetical protein
VTLWLIRRFGIRPAAVLVSEAICAGWIIAGLCAYLAGASLDALAEGRIEILRGISGAGGYAAMAGVIGAAGVLPMAWFLGPWVVDARGRLCPAILAGVATIAIADLAVCSVWLLIAIAQRAPLGDLLIFAPVTYLLGLIFVGIPTLITACPSAYVWVALLQTAWCKGQPNPLRSSY